MDTSGLYGSVMIKWEYGAHSQKGKTAQSDSEAQTEQKYAICKCYIYDQKIKIWNCKWSYGFYMMLLLFHLMSVLVHDDKQNDCCGIKQREHLIELHLQIVTDHFRMWTEVSWSVRLPAASSCFVELEGAKKTQNMT